MKKREILSMTLRLLAWDKMMSFTAKEKSRSEACWRGRRTSYVLNKSSYESKGTGCITRRRHSKSWLLPLLALAGPPWTGHLLSFNFLIYNMGIAKPPLRFVQIRKWDVCVHPVNCKGAESRVIFLFPLLLLINICLNDSYMNLRLQTQLCLNK